LLILFFTNWIGFDSKTGYLLLYEMLLGRVHLFLTEEQQKSSFHTYSPTAYKDQTKAKSLDTIEEMEGYNILIKMINNFFGKLELNYIGFTSYLSH
jgi:hypothetical protein